MALTRDRVLHAAVRLADKSGIESVTAAGPQNPMYLSLASGQVEEAAREYLACAAEVLP